MIFKYKIYLSKMIKTFVFLDSETTGLPCYENNKTRITELCLISAQADHISLGVTPRVQNKINLCFNPMRNIHYEAAKLTGLYNDELVNESSFNEVSLNLLINFVERLLQPVCLVAHNGFKFDYPILRNHIELVGKAFPDTIVCIDSLLAFRDILTQPDPHDLATQPSRSSTVSDDSENIGDEWDEVLYNETIKIEESLSITPPKTNNHQLQNETTPKVKTNFNIPATPKKSREPNNSEATKSVVQRRLNFNNDTLEINKKSFKLGDVYERLTQKKPDNAHQAEGDVQMLLQCAVHLGDTFIHWANENAILFNRIPKMEPGKKIGLVN